jgi:hypothetical protein
MSLPAISKNLKTPERAGLIAGQGTVESWRRNMAANNKPPKDSSDRKIVATRLFDAPRNFAFQMWTVRSISSLTVFFATGCNPPDRKVMWGKVVYREIPSPARLVVVNSSSDENAATTCHSRAPHWPPEVLDTLTFATHESRTTVTL